MDISPGLQLVWLMAGRETRLSEMAEIQPEHFFLALLKLADTSERQITDLINKDKNLDAINLLKEQQALIDLFEEWGITSFSIRYDLRNLIGKGDVTEPPDTYHRSFASRRLFRRAERLASEEAELMEARHLLKILLDYPPSKVKGLLSESKGAGNKLLKRSKVEEEDAGEEELVELDVGREDELYPYLYNLEPEKGFNVPQENQPQLSVLEWALDQSFPLHMVLMCEAGVPVFDLLGKVDLSLPDDICIHKVDLSAEIDAQSADTITNKLNAALGHYASEEGVLFYVDLTESSPAVTAEIISNLEEFLPQAEFWDSEIPDSMPVRVILAIAADVGNEEVLDRLAISDLYRTIWLHQLDFSRHLESV